MKASGVDIVIARHNPSWVIREYDCLRWKNGTMERSPIPSSWSIQTDDNDDGDRAFHDFRIGPIVKVLTNMRTASIPFPYNFL